MPHSTPRTVLVTGSMGFLGRHLVRRLLEDGHTVIGMDRDMDKREIQALEEDYPGRHIFVQGDLLTAFGYRFERDNSYPSPPRGVRCSYGADRTIFKILEDFKPNRLVHLAAMAQEPASRQFPAFSRVLNHDMPLDLMAAAYEYWEKLEGQERADFRMYFQSTDKVYRYDEIDGLATETSPYVKDDGPASPYAKDKAAVEQFLTFPASPFMEHGFPFLIGNLVNVIGPGDLKNQERLIQGAVHTWVRELGPYKRLIADNKDHKRQYIPVSDACSAIITILENGEPQNKYNISNGITLSNEAAIRLVQETFQELIKEGKIPAVKTEYIATDDKSFRPGAAEEDREEGLIAGKLYALGYRPAYPGVEGIKLAVREMILAEWDALQQERAASVPPPGDLSPDALKAAEQARDTIAHLSAEQSATKTAKPQKHIRKR